MLAEALTMIAIVTQDQSALRAAPKESATAQVALWQGDSLEIRGEKGDYLQVYDHRRERAGYVLASQVRVQSLKEQAAPEIISVVRFLKDTPGAEALGISYAAAYLRAAPAQAIDGEVFDALGGMAERLAQRATSAKGATAEVVSAHVAVTAHYGVKINSFERHGKIQMCYDGEAHRRVLALNATPTQKARAALALTRPECINPQSTPQVRFDLDRWRSEVLERVDMSQVPEVLKNRLHMRKAVVWASLTYQHARYATLNPGQPTAATTDAQAIPRAAQHALDELAAVNKNELMESDARTYNDAAMRVGASRWGAVPYQVSAEGAGVTNKPRIQTRPGQAGETCVELFEGKADKADKTDKGDKATPATPVLTRCTYSIVWPASVSVNPQNTALTLAVQPMDAWREMWVFQKDKDGWRVNIVPPGTTDNPELGYIESAGWTPNTPHLLAAREIKSEGRYKTTFETLHLSTLETDKAADKPNNLSPFYRWQDPIWKGGTVSLR